MAYDFLRNAASGGIGTLDEFVAASSGASVVSDSGAPGRLGTNVVRLQSGGTQEYVELREPVVGLATADVYSAWVYIPSTAKPSTGTSLIEILSSGGTSAKLVTINSNDTLTLWGGSGGFTSLGSSSGTVNYDAWNHILVLLEFGSLGNHALWLNGTEEVSGTNPGAQSYGYGIRVCCTGSGAEVRAHSIAFFFKGTSNEFEARNHQLKYYGGHPVGVTPDNGTALDAGSWSYLDSRPWPSSSAEYTGGAATGWNDTGSTTQGGPGADSSFTTGWTVDGAVFGIRAARGNGSGTEHYLIYGDETARTTTFDLALDSVPGVFFRTEQTNVGSDTIDLALGFGKDGGGRDMVVTGGMSAAVVSEAYSTGQSISPTGIASTTAFGTPKTIQGIVGTGIAAGTAFGSATVKNIQTIEATGIAPTAAFGAPQANLRIAVPGIGANNVYGIPQINQGIAGTGIAPATAFGSATVKNIQVLEPTGIAPTAAFGNPQLNQEVLAAGIAPTTVFGTATTRFRLEPTGIAPTTALGEPTLNLAGASISPPGIAATTVFGTLKTVQYVTPVALPSQTNLGGPRVGHSLDATGIAPTTAFGTPETRFGISPVGIAPAAVFGTATVIGAQTIEATGIAPQTALGAPRLDQEVRATGIPSQEAMGVPRLAQTVLAEGINPTTAFGVPRMVAVLAPTGIPSSELIGIAQLNQELQFTGIAPTTAFGEPAVLTVGGIAPPSIDPTTAFGKPTLTGGKERRGAGFVARDTTQWVTDETVDGEH